MVYRIFTGIWKKGLLLLVFAGNDDSTLDKHSIFSLQRDPPLFKIRMCHHRESLSPWRHGQRAYPWRNEILQTHSEVLLFWSTFPRKLRGFFGIAQSPWMDCKQAACSSALALQSPFPDWRGFRTFAWPQSGPGVLGVTDPQGADWMTLWPNFITGLPLQMTTGWLSRSSSGSHGLFPSWILTYSMSPAPYWRPV